MAFGSLTMENLDILNRIIQSFIIEGRHSNDATTASDRTASDISSTKMGDDMNRQLSRIIQSSLAYFGGMVDCDSEEYV
jgi:hypothetical protein